MFVEVLKPDTGADQLPEFTVNGKVICDLKLYVIYVICVVQMIVCYFSNFMILPRRHYHMLHIFQFLSRQSFVSITHILFTWLLPIFLFIIVCS